jgi:hypothetical protein
MKATKTLGAAALGAALAASAAGTASAAVISDVENTAADAVRSLPVEDAAAGLPGESGEVLTTGTDLITGDKQLPLADDTLSHTLPAQTSSSSDLGQTAQNLLGGLPVNGTDLTGGGSPLGGALDGLGD